MDYDLAREKLIDICDAYNEKRIDNIVLTTEKSELEIDASCNYFSYINSNVVITNYDVICEIRVNCDYVEIDVDKTTVKLYISQLTDIYAPLIPSEE